MITLYMSQKNNPVIIPEGAFSTETGVLSLEISLGDYSLTGKTITAVFSQTAVETAPLTVSGGLIQLPITLGLLVAGENQIQLNIREGLTLEQSPIMKWTVGLAVVGTNSVPTDVDIVTYLLAGETGYKGKNLMSYSSDLYTAFNMAMDDNSNTNFYLEAGIFITTDSLIFAEGNKLQLNPNTIIKTTNRNTPVFIMNKQCELRNGTVDASTVGGLTFLSSAILFDGNNFPCENAIVDNIKILGGYGIESKGIEFRANIDGGHYVMFCKATNVYIQHFNYGIYASGTNSGYVNGNIITGIIWGASSLIYLIGEVYGNNFDMILESGYRLTEAIGYGIYCEGGYNVFNGFIWDVGNPELTNAYCWFTETSFGNNMLIRVHDVSSFYPTSTMRDDGDRNTLGGLIPYENIYFPPTTAMIGSSGDISMLGDQDNTFAFLDKNPDFTLTKVFSGCFEINNAETSPGMMFDPRGYAIIHFDDLVDGYAQYTIDLPSQMPVLNLGVSFISTLATVNFKLYKDTLLVLEKTITQIFRIQHSIVDWNITKEYTGTNNNLKLINKVVITISKPLSASLYIRKMFGSTMIGGQTYITRNGGNIYNDLDYAIGKGPTVITPDGTKKYRIGVNNAGAITITLVS